jgi:hypothetical protein
MPLAFLLIGAVLIVVAVRGTHANLGQLLVQDFTGQTGDPNQPGFLARADKGFLVWVAAIGGVAALGFVPGMKVPAKILLALVILAILISNKGVFANAAAALQGGIQGVTVKQSQATPTEQPLPAAIPVQVTGTGSSSSSSPVGDIAGIAGTATKILPFLGF